jgi:hypothetical protein
MFIHYLTSHFDCILCRIHLIMKSRKIVCHTWSSPNFFIDVLSDTLESSSASTLEQFILLIVWKSYKFWKLSSNSPSHRTLTLLNSIMSSSSLMQSILALPTSILSMTEGLYLHKFSKIMSKRLPMNCFVRFSVSLINLYILYLLIIYNQKMLFRIDNYLLKTHSS